MRISAGYKVVATPAPIQHQGDVVLFYWDSPAFAVEAIHQFGANVIAFQLGTGERRWYIVGCYLALGDKETIRDVESSMEEPPRGAELIFVGNLNVDLDKSGVQGWDEEITATVATAGLEDLAGHFLP